MGSPLLGIQHTTPSVSRRRGLSAAALALLCLCVLPSSSSALSFSRVNQRVGTRPFEVAIGDLNSNGKPDLATANFGSNDVTVLLGNGSGGFSAAPGGPFAVGTHPHSVARADLNGDGKADLATADNGSSDVTVLLGDGAGGFSEASASPFAVGSAPTTLKIADLNRDGRLDLATANEASNDVTVLLGNGAGGFSEASASPFAVGSHPTSVGVGDFNRDGDLDLATANRDSNNVSVLLGDGAGGFSEASGSPFAVGSVPHSVAVGDFNRDGNPDLATGNQATNDVTVLLGDGFGGFSAASASPFAVGTLPTATAVGDLNFNALPDIATANRTSNNVSVLLGDGLGGFSNASGSPYAVATRPRSVAIALVNSDSKRDIVTANEFANKVTVLLNTTPK